jgi:hypothetical protein
MMHTSTAGDLPRTQNIIMTRTGRTTKYVWRPRIAAPKHNPARNAKPKVPGDNTTSELITLKNKRTKQVKKSSAGNSVSAIPTAGQRNGTARSVQPDNSLVPSGSIGLCVASSTTTQRKQQKFTQRIAGGCKRVIGDSVK